MAYALFKLNVNIAKLLRIIMQGIKMKAIHLIKVTSAIVVSALLPLVVSATENMQIKQVATDLPATSQVQFSQLDLNKNGLLSEAEVATDKLLHESFSKVDINADASISKDEYSAFIKKL